MRLGPGGEVLAHGRCEELCLLFVERLNVLVRCAALELDPDATASEGVR
jgi:hypothetical protein